MSEHPLPEQFSIAHKPTFPSWLRHFRETILPDCKPGTVALRRTHRDIVMSGKSGDFETNWEYARTLDNAGRPHDALFYINEARKQAPENTKVLGRLVEILLDLHDEMPHQRYDVAAVNFSSKLLDMEDSDFANALHERALHRIEVRETFENPKRAFAELMRE